MNVKKILLLGGTHGDEKTGIKLVEEIKKNPIDNVEPFLVNKEAVKKNKRYIETDINRTAGKKYPISQEEILANKIQKKFKNFDLIIDIHNSKTTGTFCGIVVGKISNFQLEILKYFGFKFVVIMPKEGALITPSGKRGVALEISKDKKDKFNIEFLYKKLKNIKKSKKIKKTKTKKIKIFKYLNSVTTYTFKKIKKDFGEIKNFKKLNKKQLKLLKLPNDKDIYFIFYGENAYEGTEFILVEFKKEVFI